MEALEELCGYNQKLLKAIPVISSELSGESKEDTMDFLKQFLEGLNWVIEITNLTIDVINCNQIRLNTMQVNNTMEEFNAAFHEGDKEQLAVILQNGIQLFLEDISNAAAEVICA